MRTTEVRNMRADRLSGIVQFRVASDMRAAVADAAAKDGRDPSEWLHDGVADLKEGVNGS
jgi:hypothetical protein